LLRSRGDVAAVRRVLGIIGACRTAGLTPVRRAVRVRLSGEQRFIRFAADLVPDDDDGEAPPPFVEVRIGLGELQLLRLDAPLPIEFLFDRIKGATRPYLGCWKGQLGHVSWVFAHDDDAWRVRRISLAPGEVEIDGCFTLGQFRGRGLFPAVLRAILHRASHEGFARAYMHVADNNVSSIRAAEKAGFQRVGLVTSRWTLGVHRVLAESW
jgi:ribosomal protein S18 acetylase RimI-like enzyme